MYEKDNINVTIDKAEEKTTKERIFDVSVNLFAQKGFNAASMHEIGEAVGIKKSSLYSHYKSKDEILEKIIEYPMTRIRMVGPQNIETDELIISMGLEGFMKMASGVFTDWMEDQYMEKIWRIIIIELYHNEQIKKFYSKFKDFTYSFWESNFELMMKHKLIKPSDPKVLATEYIMFYIGAYTDYFLFQYDNIKGSFLQQYKDLIDQHTAFMINSLKPLKE